MRKPTLILLMTLGACGPASVDQNAVGDAVSGAIQVAGDGTGVGHFVMRWHSRRGRQRAVASVNLSPYYGYELTVRLQATGGEAREVTGDGVDLGVDAQAVCTHRTCDMEAIGTVSVSNPNAGETVTWGALLRVEPVDPQVDLTDFTVEVLDPDAGLASR